jgi:hypothetical protein
MICHLTQEGSFMFVNSSGQDSWFFFMIYRNRAEQGDDHAYACTCTSEESHDLFLPAWKWNDYHVPDYHVPITRPSSNSRTRTKGLGVRVGTS